MCSKNVGRGDAYIRIGGGLMMICLGVMKHKGWLAALGSLEVASGVTRYCPVLDMCNCTTISDEELLEEAFGCAIDCDEYDEYDEYDDLEDEFEELEHACCCHHDHE